MGRHGGQDDGDARHAPPPCHLTPGRLPPGDRPSAVAAISVTADLVNAPEDALHAAVGKSRYQVLRTDPPSELDAARQVARDYLAAYGPASTADLTAWSGRPARAFADALATLDLVRWKAEDGEAHATRGQLAEEPRPERQARAIRRSFHRQVRPGEAM